MNNNDGIYDFNDNIYDCNNDNIIKKILGVLRLIDCKFINKPLIIGGLVLEYYGIRESENEYDIIVSKEDWEILKIKYKSYLNLLGGEKETDVDATINICIGNKKINIIFTQYQYNY